MELGAQWQQATAHQPHSAYMGLPAGPGLQPDHRPEEPHSLEPQFMEGGAAGIIDWLPPSLLFWMPGGCLLHAALQLIGVTARVILGAAWGQ